MNFKSLLLTSAAMALPFVSGVGAAQADVIAPKVMVISMFDAEAKPWHDNAKLETVVKVPGLPKSADSVACNADLCAMTTTMGFANAASSAMAVAFSDQFDLTKTYFIIAGIAGVDPQNGTLGTAAWADYVVDAGLFHRIDRSEAGEGWASTIVELGAKEPGAKPEWTAGTEVFQINPALVNAAFEASKAVELADNDDAAAYRAAYAQDAAKAKPQVTICASASADTYWHGKVIAEEIAAHVSALTEGKADYCMSQMEDNATLTALTRAAEAGRVDFSRVAVLRTASNFDRQPDGMTAIGSLTAKSGGFMPSTQNAYLVGNAFAEAIITDWAKYEGGVKAE